MRILALVLLLAACAPPTPTRGGGTAAATPAMGVPIARATFTNPFTPTPAREYASAGLGLSRRDWGQRCCLSTAEAYQAGRLRVDYLDDRVATIDETITGFDFAHAREHVLLNLMPADAAYLRTDRIPSGAVVDLFLSPSLAVRFPSARWRTPGTFMVVYAVTAGGIVPSYRVTLGEP